MSLRRGGRRTFGSIWSLAEASVFSTKERGGVRTIDQGRDFIEFSQDLASFGAVVEEAGGHVRMHC